MNSSKKMKEEDIKKIIDTFNIDFKTKIKNNDMAFLADIFNNYITMDWSEVEGTDYVTKLSEIESELLENLDDNKCKLFKRWNKVQDDYALSMAQQSFIYGVCFMIQLHKETNIGDNKEQQQ